MTEIKHSKPAVQRLSEKENIIDILKAQILKSSNGKYRSIKLPEYIFFTLDKNRNLLLDIKAYNIKKDGNTFRKNPITENMQKDNVAFEGWIICLKAWMDNINTVELRWEQPKNISLNYNRFLYRVMRFKEAYSNWFTISRENIKEVETFSRDFINLTNNSYTKAPLPKGKKDGSIGETFIEYKMVTEHSEILKSFYNIKFVDRQFPVGVKSNNIQFFPGKMSAIDLWGMNKESVCIIELKYNNEKVGIISELFLYSCIIRDIIKGVIKAPKKTPKQTDGDFYKKALSLQYVSAQILATSYHPLINKDKVFELLNLNNYKEDIPIIFGRSEYQYYSGSNKLTITSK